ncbi:Plasma membrane proteolipid 3 [Smittium culicis]|uniref:Plasma membrane proteolipid 3 n=1 Tax=Smittium culicis TaxID=133412 RepID=A0A1R1XFN6_9FUNG|nr:Plasma membrane proteolipid 3 [Smittium culicis]
MTCCSRISSVIFPPLGVLMSRGCSADLIINVALTTLGYFPGLIHSCYIIEKTNEEQYDYISGHNHCVNHSVPTVVVVSTPTQHSIQSANNVAPYKKSTHQVLDEQSFDIPPPTYDSINQ